jgi:hypothetical protein
MPIELRPSDVVLGASQALQKWGVVAQNIHDRQYEAARVSEVNKQLTYLEQIYQDHNRAMPKRGYAASLDYADPMSGEGAASYLNRVEGTGVAVQKSFGEATIEDVFVVEDEFYQEQLKYITENTTNRAAREEMIAHLAAKNVQNKAILARDWQIASQHEYDAVTMELSTTILSSDTPFLGMVNQMQSRVSEGVRVGRVYRDAGIQFMGEFASQARSIGVQKMETRVTDAVANNDREEVDAAIDDAVVQTLIPAGEATESYRADQQYKITYGIARGTAFGAIRRAPLPEEVPYPQYMNNLEALAKLSTVDQQKVRQANDPTVLMEERVDAVRDMVMAGAGPFGELREDDIQKLLGELDTELSRVRSEIKIDHTEADGELDKGFFGLHIAATTTGDFKASIQMIDDALETLTHTYFNDGNQQYIWEQRFTSLRERKIRDAKLSEPADDAIEQWQKANEDWALGDLSIRVQNNEISMADANDLVADMFYKGDVRGPFAASFITKMQAEADPYYSAGMALIREMLKGNDQLVAGAQYRAWFDSQDNVTIDQAVQAAKNFVERPEQRNLADAITGFRERSFGGADARTFSSKEQTTADIANNLWDAVAGLPENREFMNTYANEMLRVGQERFSYLGLNFAFPDYDGQFTGRSGTAVLQNREFGKSYAFTLEDNVHVLWGLQDDGSWLRMSTTAPLAPVRVFPTVPITPLLQSAAEAQAAAGTPPDEEPDPGAVRRGQDLLLNAPGRR